MECCGATPGVNRSLLLEVVLAGVAGVAGVAGALFVVLLTLIGVL